MNTPRCFLNNRTLRSVALENLRVAVVMLFLSISNNAISGSTMTLLEPVNLTTTNGVVADAAEVQQTLVKIDTQPFDVFKLGGGSRPEGDIPTNLLIALFNGEVINAELESTLVGPDGSIVWKGHAQGAESDNVYLSIKDDVVQGNINIGNEQYQIRYLTTDTWYGAIHVLKPLDLSKVPPTHDFNELPIPMGDGAAISPSASPAQTPDSDTGNVIDIMIIYTAAARDAVGGQTAMDALISLAVAETNGGYLNSNIGFSLNLVHTEMTNYSTSGSFAIDVNRLQSKTDGFMDSIHTSRDNHYADMVGLFIDNPSACGRAYAINAGEAEAFQVTHWSCATGNYTLAHEFGHLQSARHDWTADPSDNSPYTYNHGFVNPTEQWRTIMAFNNFSCRNGFCARVNYWSNPNVNFPPTGSPMGVKEGSTNASENWRALNNTAMRVANFRKRPDNYEPDDTFRLANAITTGAPQHNRNINKGGADVDWMKFTLTCTADITLKTFGADGDTQMSLFDSSGENLLAYDDDGGEGGFSLITYNDLPPGDYFVKVDFFDNLHEIADYSLSFDRTCAGGFCNGLPVTVNIAAGDKPTWSSDVILGTVGDDIIDGLGGADTICGLSGNDTIFGGNGVDWIDGGVGADTIHGEGGSDFLFGDAGADTITGGLGADTIEGGIGFDTLSGGFGADFLYGGDQNDNLSGDDGNDFISGGAGVDNIDGGSGADTIYTGTGKTVGTEFKVIGGPGADSIYGGASGDHIEGGAGQDTIYGAGGADYLAGGAGDDFIDGENGADTILGGGSNDTLEGGHGNDLIKGETGNDSINGGPANDTLNGNDGDDTLRGLDGNDTIRGGSGNDFMAGNMGDDYCNGGVGVDTAISTCETILQSP